MLAGATPGPATNRQGRLHRFRRPVDQQKVEMVEWCPPTTRHLVSDAATAAGVTRRRRARATRNSREKMALLTERTLRQSKATEHDRGEQRADVGLKPLETRPYTKYVVPTELRRQCRARECRHGLQKNHVLPTHSCGSEKRSVKRARKQFLW